MGRDYQGLGRTGPPRHWRTKGNEDRGRINGSIRSTQFIVTMESSFNRMGWGKARCPRN